MCYPNPLHPHLENTFFRRVGPTQVYYISYNNIAVKVFFPYLMWLRR